MKKKKYSDMSKAELIERLMETEAKLSYIVGELKEMSSYLKGKYNLLRECLILY